MKKIEIDHAVVALKREKERTSMAAYREANPEKVRAAKAKYYAANREKVKAENAAYYAANLENIKAARANDILFLPTNDMISIRPKLYTSVNIF